VSPWLEDPSRARAPLSPDVLRRSARQARCMRFLRARSRVSVMRLVAPAGVATGDASDRLLHSETVPTRALVLRRFPAQRPSSSDALLSSHTIRGSLSSRNLAAPCSFTRTSLSRATSPVRRLARQAPVGSGPSDANEARENLASRRDSHFGNRTMFTRWRFLPPCEIEPTASGTPVASSVPFAWIRFSSNPDGGSKAAKTGSAGAS